MVKLQNFQNSNFCFRAWILSLATLSCFPWNSWFALFIFKKMYIKYQGINNHSVPNRNGVQWKKRALIHNLNNHTVLLIKVFYFVMYPKHFTCTLHFVTQSIKKTCTQELRFNKISDFCCFIKDPLKWRWLFFFLQVQVNEELKWLISMVPLPWFILRHQHFPLLPWNTHF